MKSLLSVGQAISYRSNGMKYYPPSIVATATKQEVGFWLFGFYGISTFVSYLTPKQIFMQIVLFQVIQHSMSTFCQKHFNLKLFSFIQTVLIQFTINTDFVYTVTSQNGWILNYSV